MGRERELSLLDYSWDESEVKIVQLVAPGGVGKTQLIKKWQERVLSRAGSGEPVRVFDWSFYVQGTGGQASTDEFFAQALRWFGEPPTAALQDPWIRGERLAELIKQYKTLLILDGLEPLQHAPGPLHGELRDPAIAALLDALQWGGTGLCVVTTRLAVPNIAGMDAPKTHTVNLGNLTPTAGAELLRQYGISGEGAELEQGAIDVDCHALALVLLATYLRSRCNGDIGKRAEAILYRGHERYTQHARKVMVSYEKWFEQEGEYGRAAIAVLRLLGLFDRPADARCLEVLRSSPPIEGLTEPLFVNDPEDAWQRAIERLIAARLVDLYSINAEIGGYGGGEVCLDAHPLIKEHFAEQIKEQFENSAKEAHRRLFRHLESSTVRLPDSLEKMIPLYQAIPHGCKAGLAEETLDRVFSLRILRRQEFSWKKLGAVASDLAACGYFFERPWDRLIPEIVGTWRSFLFGHVGLMLRAVGRVTEAVPPMRSAERLAIEDADWINAAVGLGNCFETQLLLGDVSAALGTGVRAVSLSDRLGIPNVQYGNVSKFAHLLHCIGEHKSAETLFRWLMQLRKRSDVQYPFLVSMPSYWYCGFLERKLSQVVLSPVKRPKESRRSLRVLASQLERLAMGSMKLSEAQGSAFEQGLDILIVAKARLIRFISGQDVQIDEVRKMYNRGVNLIRSSGQYWILIDGIFARAVFSRFCHEFSEADEDLSIIESMATHSSMLIWRIEAAVERAYLFLAMHGSDNKRGGLHSSEIAVSGRQSLLEKAMEKLHEARELIQSTERTWSPPNDSTVFPPYIQDVRALRPGQSIGYYRRNADIALIQKIIGDG